MASPSFILAFERNARTIQVDRQDERRGALKGMAMKIQNIQELMVTGMTYTLDFEEQVGQAAPKMAEASSNPELKELFSKTQPKSKEYGQRIEQVFEKLGRPVQKNDITSQKR